MMEELKVYTAVFPLVKYAVVFAARIREEGWWTADVVQRGRTVTWVRALPEGVEDEGHGVYLADMLGTVGYFGSTQRRKATLNGIPAPVSY